MADPESQPPGLPFPTDPQEFDSDERISFSRLDNKFIAVLDDGSEFEWDAQLKRWIPSIDEELLAQQQSAYGGGRDASEDDSSGTSRKRKNGSAEQRSNKRQRPPPAPRQNTAVYVTGLPLDVTVDEVHDVFSRKCGVIAEEIDSGRPRIKLYTDEKGNLQGDALVVFFKPQSVEMAIMLLDDTDFRYTASGLSSGRMRVQAAESKYKKTNYDRDGEGDTGEHGNGASSNTAGGDNNNNSNNNNSNGAHNPITGAGKPRDKGREQDKQKIIKRTQKLDAKLADWDEDDDSPFAAQLETNAPKGRVVILRHMFTLRELEEDPAAMLEIKEDIRDECSKLGTVTNVVLYDLEEDGIASVKFNTPEAAAACVDLMDGRAFDGRTVRATIASAREKYRRSDKDGGEDDED
ncbi:hypothetical protein F5Y03DRAFT_238468 [Xylaria venustula]|nr:hypothetical protein F5Y03DRAFT_238468 [Xylaria venustula]